MRPASDRQRPELGSDSIAFGGDRPIALFPSPPDLRVVALRSDADDDPPRITYVIGAWKLSGLSKGRVRISVVITLTYTALNEERSRARLNQLIAW